MKRWHSALAIALLIGAAHRASAATIRPLGAQQLVSVTAHLDSGSTCIGGTRSDRAVDSTLAPAALSREVSAQQSIGPACGAVFHCVPWQYCGCSSFCAGAVTAFAALNSLVADDSVVVVGSMHIRCRVGEVVPTEHFGAVETAFRLRFALDAPSRFRLRLTTSGYGGLQAALRTRTSGLDSLGIGCSDCQREGRLGRGEYMFEVRLVQRQYLELSGGNNADLMYAVQLTVVRDVAVTESAWSSVKALYGKNRF